MLIDEADERGGPKLGGKPAGRKLSEDRAAPLAGATETHALPDRLSSDGALCSLERDRDRGDPDAGDGELAELTELGGRPRPRFDSGRLTPRVYGRPPNNTREILARIRLPQATLRDVPLDARTSGTIPRSAALVCSSDLFPSGRAERRSRLRPKRIGHEPAIPESSSRAPCGRVELARRVRRSVRREPRNLRRPAVVDVTRDRPAHDHDADDLVAVREPDAEFPSDRRRRVSMIFGDKRARFLERDRDKLEVHAK